MFTIEIELEEPELLSHYKSQIDALERTYSYMESDSGFDLYLPNDVTIEPGQSKMIDLKIKVQPNFAGGYYLYPRSSISKCRDPKRKLCSVGAMRTSLSVLAINTLSSSGLPLNSTTTPF
jgi:hypothetical protein